MNTAAGRILFSIEDEIYREFLKDALSNTERKVDFVAKGELVQTLADTNPGILVIQSDQDEFEFIELSRKLKRLFGEELKVLLLSSDYLTEEVAGFGVDGFLQYPTGFEQIEDALEKLESDSRRILLVDDSKLVHNSIVPSLLEAGYEIIEAFDGEEGFAKAKQTAPDLIICDIEMPKMTGFEVCAAIRKEPEISDTYIIMSSTLGSAADQQRGFDSGVDEYITKPVVIPELLDRLKKVFKSARVGRENILSVVEDETTARNISKSLGKQGFSIRHVSNIRQALKAAKRMNFDLAISEMYLEDGSMINLLEALRGLPEGRAPELLILTSRDARADEKMVQNAGAAGIIIKPFTLDSLLAAVERTLADRRAAQERAQIEKYMSKASKRMALEKSILSGSMASTRADKRTATVFFSDIVSFTARCEKYSPKEVVAQVNTLFEMMTRVIMDNEGDIDKFIGDACLAFWVEEDPKVSAEKAVLTLLQLREELVVMNQQHPALVEDPIKIRVGLNTGELILCDIGSAEARIDLTVIGDAVNVAARFESGSKQYGLNNLLGASTIEPLLDSFSARPIDCVKVKGKDQPLRCFELLGEKGKTTENQDALLEQFSAAFELYSKGDFKQAQILFQTTEKLEAVQEAGAINPSRLYIERCDYLVQNPPADWEGVWTLTSK